jgi:hypothetical protein
MVGGQTCGCIRRAGECRNGRFRNFTRTTVVRLGLMLDIVTLTMVVLAVVRVWTGIGNVEDCGMGNVEFGFGNARSSARPGSPCNCSCAIRHDVELSKPEQRQR